MSITSVNMQFLYYKRGTWCITYCAVSSTLNIPMKMMELSKPSPDIDYYHQDHDWSSKASMQQQNYSNSEPWPVWVREAYMCLINWAMMFAAAN